MAEGSVPVDLTNPGQVFACLGLVEAADILLGEARGGFDWRDGGDTRFRIAAAGRENPVVRALRFLDEANVASQAPVESDNRTEKWQIDTISLEARERTFPFPDPRTPATLPARLEDSAGNVVMLEHWGDETRRDNVKFWAGSGGYPGARLARDALTLICGRAVEHADDPFALAAEQSSSFRFDWRRDYVPIDAGFSPNAHRDKYKMRGYPVVELMAVIGVTHARPSRRDKYKLDYSYGVAGLVDSELYDPVFLRATLGARRPPFPGLPFRLFRMRLGWPGQKGQARCIMNVIEETQPS